MEIAITLVLIVSRIDKVGKISNKYIVGVTNRVDLLIGMILKDLRNQRWCIDLCSG